MGLGYWYRPVRCVSDLIKDWRPRRCRTEKDYERSLVRYLESKLEGKEIVPQFASGRVRADIVIDRKILIEIKVNLDSTAKLHTLLGQVEIYEREWKQSVIVVLCGDHDANLIKQLGEAVQRRASDLFLLDSPWLHLVVK